jgi:hypothetical protein
VRFVIVPLGCAVLGAIMGIVCGEAARHVFGGGLKHYNDLAISLISVGMAATGVVVGIATAAWGQQAAKSVQASFYAGAAITVVLTIGVTLLNFPPF